MPRLVSLALAATLLLAAPAAAQTWGSGTFTGKAKSQFGADRPRTAVTVVVRGAKVRIKQLKLSYNCGGGRRVAKTVRSGVVRVEAGPAGGGARLKLPVRLAARGTTYTGDVDVFLGLRATTVSGTVSSYLNRARGPEVCEDGALFTARR